MPTALRCRLAALSLGALAACSDSAPVAPDTASDAALQITSRIVEGRTGPNSLYAIFTPRSWSGDAIVYVRYATERDRRSPHPNRSR
jgi:hypothetical protein